MKSHSNPVLIKPKNRKRIVHGGSSRPDSGKLEYQEKLIDSQRNSIIKPEKIADSIVSLTNYTFDIINTNYNKQTIIY